MAKNVQINQMRQWKLKMEKQLNTLLVYNEQYKDQAVQKWVFKRSSLFHDTIKQTR